MAHVEEILQLATRWHVFPTDKDPYSIGERERETQRDRERESEREMQNAHMVSKAP